MEIIKAPEMGFCFGVRRALDLVTQALRERGSLESLGPIVHNRQVVERLSALGLRVVDKPEEVLGKAVVITSHGVGPQPLAQIRACGLEVIDATCPFVRKAHSRARRMIRDGLRVVIFGEASHPEVQGILGWARGKGLATLDPQEAAAFARQQGPIGVLAQTTQSAEGFESFLGAVADLTASAPPNANTICPPTLKRNRAAVELARQVELVVVAGGKNSANTRRLVEICGAAGVPAHHVESAEELEEALIRGRGRVGVTAGASTPDEVISEVVARLEQMAADSTTKGKGCKLPSSASASTPRRAR